MFSPAEIYAERLEAVQAQNARIYRAAPIGGPVGWPNSQAVFGSILIGIWIGTYLSLRHMFGPEDTLLDVGGGAGRVGPSP
ncbi:MAG: hypothetical protein CM1200mP22_00110 [Dehalococcoidia bacterium]|nr:MAG: hypothetical protein CM1200mP22_00110 [Dehalococcoidia bacterium]